MARPHFCPSLSLDPQITASATPKTNSVYPYTAPGLGRPIFPLSSHSHILPNVDLFPQPNAPPKSPTENPSPLIPFVVSVSCIKTLLTATEMPHGGCQTCVDQGESDGRGFLQWSSSGFLRYLRKPTPMRRAITMAVPSATPALNPNVKGEAGDVRCNCSPRGF